MDITIDNNLNIEDIVYLKHYTEQKTRQVTGVIIDKYCVMYELVSGTEYSKHYSFELSKDKIIY